MERKREGRRKKISSHRDTVFLFENISEFIRDQENAMLPRLAQKKKKKRPFQKELPTFAL